MSATNEINTDTIPPLVQDSVTAPAAAQPVQQAAADTASTVAVTVQPDAATSDSQGVCLAGWLGVGLSVCVGILAWKMISDMKKVVIETQSRLAALAKSLKDAKGQINALSSRVEASGSAPRNYTQPQYSAVDTGTVSAQLVHKAEEKKKAQKVPATEICFASLQSPDARGVLRFSERSMTTDRTPEKFFMLEINPEAGVGTYRINPDALDLIRGDLQLLGYYVKPFSFNGDSLRAKISDKKPGKIIKRGKFWEVEERLEISIH